MRKCIKIVTSDGGKRGIRLKYIQTWATTFFKSWATTRDRPYGCISQQLRIMHYELHVRPQGITPTDVFPNNYELCIMHYELHGQ